MNSMSKNLPSIGGTAASGPTMDGYSSSAATVSSTQRQVAGLLLVSLDVLRDGCDDPELPAQIAAMLLHVANRKEPIGVVELGELAGMSKASASRVVQLLGRGSRDKEGRGLLETYEDPANWSRKLVKLSPKGVRLIQTLEGRFMSGIRHISTGG